MHLFNETFKKSMDKRHERHEIVPSVMKQKKNRNIYCMITDANSTHYSLFVFAFCFNTFSYTAVNLSICINV